jgi:hypothetical protein
VRLELLSALIIATVAEYDIGPGSRINEVIAVQRDVDNIKGVVIAMNDVVTIPSDKRVDISAALQRVGSISSFQEVSTLSSNIRADVVPD